MYDFGEVLYSSLQPRQRSAHATSRATRRSHGAPLVVPRSSVTTVSHSTPTQSTSTARRYASHAILGSCASSDARSPCSAENPRASFERIARARRHRTFGPVADVTHRRSAAAVGHDRYDHPQPEKYPHLESKFSGHLTQPLFAWRFWVDADTKWPHAGHLRYEPARGYAKHMDEVM